MACNFGTSFARRFGARHLAAAVFEGQHSHLAPPRYFYSHYYYYSTAAWRAKRANDGWATRAAAEGVRSRAAYKLEEINQRFGKFLRPGVNVVDLGAAPGGFSVVAARLVKPSTTSANYDYSWKIPGYYGDDGEDLEKKNISGVNISHQKRRPNGRVVSVDLQEMEEVAGAVFVQGDAAQDRTLQQIYRGGLGGQEADVILSDMAPNTATDPLVSHVKSMQLARTALHTADRLLRSGGTLVVKVFMGEDEPQLRKDIAARFVDVQAYTPKASKKKKSNEHYIVARRFVKNERRIDINIVDGHSLL